MSGMRQAEWDQIQGVVRSDYQNLPFSSFLVCEFQDQDAARAWLSELAVTSAEFAPTTTATNLALTHSGLRKLWGESFAAALPREFEAGMARRGPGLGDDVERWEWGRSGRIDMLLMLYASTAKGLGEHSDKIEQGARDNTVEILHRLEAHPLEGNREHFGFRDGISNPTPVASGAVAAEDAVPLGEFVLGYPAANPRDPVWKEQCSHLLKNGSFLVFRQLRQDVQGFWSAVRSAAESIGWANGDEDVVRLAAKMMGRWPNGNPIATHAEEGEPCSAAELNDFDYTREGQGCPPGAHIRRANPRAGLTADPARSHRLMNGRRILRRGRTYGPPPANQELVPERARTRSLSPDSGQPGGTERGLLFMCLNADIGEQFEYVQKNWLNYPKLGGAHDSVDPIAGVIPEATSFCIPEHPVRRRVSIATFVTVAGGGYFFLPGLNLLSSKAKPSRG